jgi:uncharacterized protein (UPF0335 family)
MSSFGDYDPDDAWDATDTVIEELRVIIERILWLVEHRDELEQRIEAIAQDLGQIRARVLNREL